MGRSQEASQSAAFERRLGKSALELGDTSGSPSCPDIWGMERRVVGIIGRDVTEAYQDRLPEGVTIGPGQRLVIIPRNMLIAAKADIPDA